MTAQAHLEPMRMSLDSGTLIERSLDHGEEATTGQSRHQKAKARASARLKNPLTHSATGHRHNMSCAARTRPDGRVTANLGGAKE
jgi:hypothetical protein